MGVEFISHRGAKAGEANLHELRWSGGHLLLDCGADGASKSVIDGLERPDAVWVSHAHGDHCAGLLQLAARWPRVPLLATETTKRLLGYALAGGDDTGGRRAEAVAKRVRTVEMKQFRPLPGVNGAELMALPAGHVPGAAMALVRCEGTVVLYTGDFCTHDQAVVDGAGIPQLGGGESIDVLVTEAVLATDEQADRLRWDEEASKLVEAVEKADGPVLIGVGAIGESTEVASLLVGAGVAVMVDEMLREVFEVCAPRLVDEVSFAGRRRMKQRLDAGGVVIAAGDQFRRTSSAGRLAGRIIDDASATIVVLNRARETTGAGRLVGGARGDQLEWAGRPVVLEAEVVHRRLINHAPRWQLDAVIRGVGAKKTLLVHGTDGARWALKRAVQKAGYNGEVVVGESGVLYAAIAAC